MTLVITIFGVLSVFILAALHKIEIFWIQLFLYNTTVLGLSDPGNGNVTADCHSCNSYHSFHIHKILSILNVLSVYENYRKCVEKMYIEGTLTSKSCNIALILIKITNFMLYQGIHKQVVHDSCMLLWCVGIWKYFNISLILIVQNYKQL